ncbi:hypothetical protein R6Q59_005074 [Mikania micrantha]
MMAEPINSDIFRCRNKTGTFQPNSPYKKNLMSALNEVTSKTEKESGYNSATFGTKDNEVRAAAFCAAYLKPNDCVSCVKKTITLLQQKCSNHKEAASWRVTCMVRYGKPTPNDYELWFVAHEVSVDKSKDVPGLGRTVPDLASMLMKKVYSPRGPSTVRGYAYDDMHYGTSMDPRTVYMAMQCTPYILPRDCNACLGRVSGDLQSCCKGAMAAAVLTPNCYIRYAHADFRG